MGHVYPDQRHFLMKKIFLKQELSSDSIARLEKCLFKVKKSFWQSFMKTGSKLCLLDSTHGFSKNWPNDLIFDPTCPILNSGLDLITTHIQTKFHEDWIKLCLLESTHGFSKNWPNDLVFYMTWPIFKSGQDFIMMNILTKFHEDWIKSCPLECIHGFT